jgi:hypothetical protein
VAKTKATRENRHAENLSAAANGASGPAWFDLANEEDLCARCTLTWLPDVKMIRVDSVDVAASKSMQARLAEYDPELAKQYGEDMKRPGAAWPRIWAWRRLTRHVILGGNHRHGGAQHARLTHVGAYVIDSDETDKIELFASSLNSLSGREEPVTDRLKKALFARNRFHYTAQQLGPIFNLNPDMLKSHFRSEDMRQNLVKDVPGIGTVNKSVLEKLAPLEDNGVVLVEAARLATSAQLTADQAAELVRDIKSMRRSESDKLAVIKEAEKSYTFINQPEPRERSVMRNSLRIQVLNKMKECSKKLEQVEDPSAIGAVGENLKLFKELATKIQGQLHSLFLKARP